MTIIIANKTGVVVALLSCLAVACSGSSNDDEQTVAEPASKDHVWQDQVDVLDKAREAEDILLEAQKERAKQLDVDP